MGDNSFGNLFKITSFGESHGYCIGIIIDGIPAGLMLDLELIQRDLDKRKPGQSKLTTPRSEEDKVKILSGILDNMTTGAPVCLIIENKDVDTSKYEKFKDFLRPSQVDYVASKKYGGFADFRGSGRFSGRNTAGFVMAGAIAKQLLALQGISIFAYTHGIGNVVDDSKHEIDDLESLIKKRESSLVRALDQGASRQMIALIEEVKNNKDSIGGSIKCIINNFPVGIGGPIFNSLESTISRAIFSIPAIKGIEFGAGFKATGMKGSEHNDPWIIENDTIRTTKNDSGGIIGGISTGMPIEFRIAVKPTATIGILQKTVNIKTMENAEIEITGRHDPCIVPRAVVVVEAMTAIVLVDHLMQDGIIPNIL